MRLLLDECVPRRFAGALTGVEVRHVVEMGWSGVKTGRLLELAVAAGFDGLVTTDANLPQQQSIATTPIFLIVLRARSNRLADLQPLSAAVLQRLAFAQPGRISFVGP